MSPVDSAAVPPPASWIALAVLWGLFAFGSWVTTRQPRGDASDGERAWHAPRWLGALGAWLDDEDNEWVWVVVAGAGVALWIVLDAPWQAFAWWSLAIPALAVAWMMGLALGPVVLIHWWRRREPVGDGERAVSTVLIALFVLAPVSTLATAILLARSDVDTRTTVAVSGAIGYATIHLAWAVTRRAERALSPGA